MLSGRAAYEGSNFMEILHKKANQAPAPMSTFRDDIPPEIEDLVKRTMATDPAARPQSMEEFERELTEISWQVLPPIIQDRVWTGGPAGSPNANPVLSDTPRPVVVHGARAAALWRGDARASVAALWERLSTDRRRLSAVGAAGFVMIALVVFGINRSRANLEYAGSDSAEGVSAATRPGSSGASAPSAGGGSTYAVPEAALQNPTGVAAAAAAAAEGPAEGAEGNPSATDADSEPAEMKSSRSVAALKARTAGGGPSAAEAKKMLGEGEQLLRAQRFKEAGDVFAKLTKSKATRGRALVAIAEIAFQEKNYEQTIRSAKLAADRGGGARARVLLGDAHFRLSHFQDAAAAYGQALRLDPANASAKSGLALASKRM
jgi:hypothetical protein